MHGDIEGPLPVSQGFSYIFTMIDRTTRWPEAVTLSSIPAESCVQVFISTWVSRFGGPAVLTSDRGSQFTSSVWTGVCSTLGISASTTTSFHPQSNGMVERFHRSLKSSLRARLANSDWISHLPMVLLGLRATPKDDTGLSVSEAVYGAPLTLPGELVDVPELLHDTLLRKVNRAVEGLAVPPPHHVHPVPPVQLPAALISAKYVFVGEDSVISTLAPRYRGPYLVVDRKDKYFCLQVGSKQDLVSVDHLKPVFSDTPVTTALPPPRGRPRLKQHLLLQLLRLCPLPRLLRGLGFHSILKLFRHLYLYDGTLTDLQEIEGSAPPFLRRSFWGEYCGGYECRLPEYF